VDDAFGRDIDNEEREDRTKPYVISLQKVAHPHGAVSAGMFASAVRRMALEAAQFAYIVEPFASLSECRA
jgi:hypothetical protein